MEICYTREQTGGMVFSPSIAIEEGAPMQHVEVRKSHPKALGPLHPVNTPKSLHSDRTERVVLPEPHTLPGQVVITSLLEQYWQDDDGWNYSGTFLLPIDIMQSKRLRVRVKRSHEDILSFVWLEALDREHACWNILRDIPFQLMQHASQFEPGINAYEFSKVGEPLVQSEVQDMLSHAAQLFIDE